MSFENQVESQHEFLARMVGKTCQLCKLNRPFTADDLFVVEIEQPDGSKVPAHTSCFTQRENQDLKAEVERAHVVFAATLAKLGGALDLREIDFRRARASDFRFDHAELPTKGHRFTLKKPLVVLASKMPQVDSEQSGR